MSVPDLAEPFVTALTGDGTITGYLEAYLGSYPVFSKVPVPDDAPNPQVVVATQLQTEERDGVADQRPVIERDILVYGTNGRDSTNDQFRTVEAIAFAVHDLFHRQKTSLSVSGWTVVDVLASGPAPAPVDDEQTVGRRVTVRVMLARQN